MLGFPILYCKWMRLMMPHFLASAIYYMGLKFASFGLGASALGAGRFGFSVQLLGVVPTLN